jgi:hypothetical protein
MFDGYPEGSTATAGVDLVKEITFVPADGSDGVELDPDVDYNMANGQVGADPAVGGGEGKFIILLRYDGDSRYLPAISKITTTIGPRAIELGVLSNHMITVDRLQETDTDGNYVNISDIESEIMDSIYAKDLAQDEDVADDILETIKNNLTLSYYAKSTQEHSFTFKFTEDNPDFRDDDGKLIVQTETIRAGLLNIKDFTEENDSRSIKGVNFPDGAVIVVVYDDGEIKSLELPYSSDTEYYQFDTVDAGTEIDNETGFSYISLPGEVTIPTSQIISLGVSGSDYTDLSKLQSGVYRINFTVDTGVLSEEDYNITQSTDEKLVIASALTVEVDLLTRAINRMNNDHMFEVNNSLLSEPHFTSSMWNNNQFSEHSVENQYFKVVVGGTDTELPESMTRDMLVRFKEDQLSSSIALVQRDHGEGPSESSYRARLRLDQFSLVNKTEVESEEGPSGTGDDQTRYEFDEVQFATVIQMKLPSFNVAGRIVKMSDWIDSNLSSENEEGVSVPAFNTTEAHTSNFDNTTNDTLTNISNDIETIVPEIDSLYDVIEGNTTNEATEYWNELLNSLNNHVTHFRDEYEFTNGMEHSEADTEARREVTRRYILPAMVAIDKGKMEKLSLKVEPTEHHYNNFVDGGRVEVQINSSGTYDIRFNVFNGDIESITIGAIAYTNNADESVSIDGPTIERDETGLSGTVGQLLDIKRLDTGTSIIMSDITMRIHRPAGSIYNENYPEFIELLNLAEQIRTTVRRDITDKDGNVRRLTFVSARSRLSQVFNVPLPSGTSSTIVRNHYRAYNDVNNPAQPQYIDREEGVYTEEFNDNLEFALLQLAEVESE